MIPKQVEEAVELAEELHAKMFAPQEDEQPEEEPSEPTPEPEPAAPSNTEPPEDYESRYKVLKGKYDAEVPRLHHELKELKEAVFSRLGDMTKKEEPKEAPVDPYAEKLAKFEEEYGKDFLEMQRILARREAEELLNKRVQPIEEQVSTVEETQIKAAQQNFMTYLDEKVEKGDWRTLWSGQDEKFNAFLQQREPTTGLSYAQIVRYHNDNWDADGLANIFNTYLGTPEPPIEQPKKVNPAKEALVAPSRTTHTAPPPQSDKRIWSSSMIEQFKRDDRMGKYSQEESGAMWNDLLAAMNEGRIRG